MTTDGQTPTSDDLARGIASEAALFVNFYIPRDKAPPLYERLQARVQYAREITADGEATHTGVLSPRVRYPSAAHDTAIISFAIDAPEQDAGTAWAAARLQLEGILGDSDLPNDWWGYSLIYQAVLNPGVGIDSVPLELLSTVRRPTAGEGLEPLEQADVAGSRLWLMGIPRGDDLAAATVYIALSTSEQEERLKAVLLGPEMTFLDLIAHKGYYLKREYSGDLQRDYEEGLKAFRNSTLELLDQLGQHIEETSVEDLARKDQVFVKVVPELKRLRVSVAQQLPNYTWWQKRLGINSITEYHYGHLDIAHRELELMITRGQDALEAANTAMTMARIQIDQARVEAEKNLADVQRNIDKAQASRQQLTQTFLAVVAASLAIPQLIDRDAAGALIGIFVPVSWSNNLLVQLATQVTITVFFALLAVLVVWGLNERWRRRDITGR